MRGRSDMIPPENDMNEGVATDERIANTSRDYHEYIFREVEYKRMAFRFT